MNSITKKNTFFASRSQLVKIVRKLPKSMTLRNIHTQKIQSSSKSPYHKKNANENNTFCLRPHMSLPKFSLGLPWTAKQYLPLLWGNTRYHPCKKKLLSGGLYPGRPDGGCKGNPTSSNVFGLPWFRISGWDFTDTRAMRQARSCPFKKSNNDELILFILSLQDLSSATADINQPKMK